MTQSEQIVVPILVIGFNRPDVIKQTLMKLRESKPQLLYFVIDAARKGVQGEDELVSEVKSIVTDITWSCQTFYKFNKTNLGAEITISSAISWVLSQNKYVVVLEDDIIAPYSFLKFAQDMLIKYENVDKIYQISGVQSTPIEMSKRDGDDYLFGLYGHTWGWATWRRAWTQFNLSVNDFDQSIKDATKTYKSCPLSERKYYVNLIKRLQRNGIGKSTWDNVWLYVRLRDQGLSIIPSVNLTSNIGIYGLHARGQNSTHFRSIDEDYVVRKEPNSIERNIYYDLYHFNKQLRPTPFILRLFNKFSKLISNSRH